MRIRRPLASLLTALALLGGGTATMTACGSPTTPEEGTTDDTGEGGEEGRGAEEFIPGNSDPQIDVEDQTDDTQDPD